ncbi:class I SAM-dependent methyltransferase [Brevundimonas aurantiaca]|uniref:class I SAM-dependent methyltransferase n=1 Tax=Brevundimonas aurantiaca TaxID=74316 RepID=UPI00174D9864|nr:class I SAM-dependent methyltransferase [Brevundimonas aurantiaca]
MFRRLPTKTKNLSGAERESLLAEIKTLKAELAKRDQQPHFVTDYTAYVRQLLSQHSLDDAMSYAVGGSYDTTGSLLVEVLKRAGLREGMSIIDLGCGSGRLAKHLGLQFSRIEYLGIDIVQELIDYAKIQSPTHFQFTLNHDLRIPAEDATADIVAIFSVITHLLHQESYLYLEQAKRTLRPGGRIVFSFLESEKNWPIFHGMVSRARDGVKDDQLNMFTERSQIECWARHLGLAILGYDYGLPHTGDGQTVAVLELID